MHTNDLFIYKKKNYRFKKVPVICIEIEICSRKDILVTRVVLNARKKISTMKSVRLVIFDFGDESKVMCVHYIVMLCRVLCDRAEILYGADKKCIIFTSAAMKDTNP